MYPKINFKMKKYSFLLLGIFVAMTTIAQSESEAIIGDWYNQEKDAIIQIFTEDGKIHGKITWMLNPLDENGNPKTDHLNPEKSLQSRPRLGMVMMYDFEYDGNNIWNEGEVYDPKSGNTYSGMVTLTSPNNLDLKGYIGIPLFGRTSNWTRKLD